MTVEGTIINLTRYCTDDGPGIRYDISSDENELVLVQTVMGCTIGSYLDDFSPVWMGLDADTRDRVVALLRRECADKTLLLVTHDPREAEALCDSVLTYQDGIFA